ncbi:transcriptional regulator BetI [Shewanella sp. OPT22]|uniref:transcriptional regulator BetI n=1 Tax=Parashewanella hymeniacidonis TaxID=2807618 RepID=UPI001020FF6E|nr:transcriptional regulator BetI [Parashewanella hymeniacidonis]MBM7073582.1 transcriptional regulator BetI [Parashewanella hymeniacidonis]RYV02369.1 transcriptional regulator BetI [Shewanella sp. OPT22]
MQRCEIKAKRTQDLIDATLISVDQHGLHHTTIKTISSIAGISSGLISHYFDGKQGLIEATQRYLLDNLKHALLIRVQNKKLEPQQRLFAIVEANFTDLQCSNPATKTWLSFWAQAMHEPQLARLQKVNNQRLVTNLQYSFAQALEKNDAIDAAKQTAAMIDGFWLRSALQAKPEEAFKEAEQLCKRYISERLR